MQNALSNSWLASLVLFPLIVAVLAALVQQCGWAERSRLGTGIAARWLLSNNQKAAHAV